jgi:hypothetical protein
MLGFADIQRVSDGEQEETNAMFRSITIASIFAVGTAASAFAADPQLPKSMVWSA